MPYKPLRILLIHDSEESRSETRKLLLQTDLVQTELDCVPVNLAVESFRRNDYTVCIIDAPGKGIPLLEISLRLGFTTPILMITADDAAEVLAAMRLGSADCLIRDTLTARSLEESICVAIEAARSNDYEADCARLYLSLVEHSSEIVYTHDLEGNSIFINRAGEQLIKYRLEEVSQFNFRQLISPECVDNICWTIERMLAERKTASCQTFFMSKEGQRIPVSVTMHLVYKEGSPVGVQGIARDLSWQLGCSTAAESEQMVCFLL